jgi:hypothetical protein
MVVVWPKLARQVVILTLTSRGSVIVAFLGEGLAIETDPDEEGFYPDLTHPATAGILLAMWLKWSPQAWMSVCRWTKEEEAATVEEKQPKCWSITMDLGRYDQDAEGSYLGTALARMLLQTWRRQERLTPMRLDAADPDSGDSPKE